VFHMKKGLLKKIAAVSSAAAICCTSGEWPVYSGLLSAGASELAPSDAVSGKVIVNNVGTASYGSSVIAGDFDGNGIIDAFDLALARRTMLNRFSGSTAPIDMRTADLNGSGDFEIADIVLLSRFLLKDINRFPETTATTTVTTVTTTSTTTTTPVFPGDNSYMKQIADDMVIKAPYDFTQMRAGVDYGTMEHRTYYSKDAGMNKNMNILLPPGYDPNEKYPVLYVLHGIFGDESSMPGMGIQTMLGNLIADGKAEKMIIVFPAMFTGPGSPGFDSEAARKYDLIREDIENSIMPFLAENYSIKTGRENTAVTGFSMGGREALYTGITRSEVYGYVGGACPAPGIFPTRDNYMTHEGCMSPAEFKPSAPPRLLLISAAANDGVVGNYPRTYHEALDSNGAEHLWQVIPDGDHGGATVTPHMYNFLRYVFK
jgi:glucuronoarabinoxylan endo-1,4-beta-xylanase